MQIHTESTTFIEKLQEYSGRKLNFPQDVRDLLDLAMARHREELFRDAIFHAKFAVKTGEIVARIGPGGEGFDKLSAELQNSLEKTSALLKTLVKESPEGIKKRFVNDFFSLDQRSFGNFMKLLEDLGWVKNWEVDGKPLPFNDSQPARTTAGKPDHEEISRLRKSSVLGIILMIAMLVIDPPVVYLGWGIAIVVVMLFLYIAIASRMLEKK